MTKRVQDLKEIKIVPNGKGGVKLFVNGKKIDLEDVTDIRLGLSHDEENGVVFELSARKRVCLLMDYEQSLRGGHGKENSEK